MCIHLSQVSVKGSEQYRTAQDEKAFRANIMGKDRQQQQRVGRKAGSARVKLNDMLHTFLTKRIKKESGFFDFVYPAATAAGAYQRMTHARAHTHSAAQTPP